MQTSASSGAFMTAIAVERQTARPTQASITDSKFDIRGSSPGQPENTADRAPKMTIEEVSLA